MIVRDLPASDRCLSILDDVVPHLAAALQGFERADMKLYAAVSRRCLGQLTGGPSSEQYLREADEWMTAQDIVKPSRMTQMIAPGFA